MNLCQSTLRISALLALSGILHAETDTPAAPWLAPRSMDNFRALLDRSPFSLPTAEETAPGEERYFLTGAATINGEPVVFVFDKNTQVRHMLGRTPNGANNKLLEYTPAMSPRDMRARIRMDGADISVAYSDFGAEAGGAPQGPGVPPPMQPPQQAAIPGQPQPPVPPQIIQPGAGAQDQPPRRVIRRRVISGQPPAVPPQQGP